MPREIENAESAAEVRSGSRSSELTELIDYIRGKIEAEEEKIKETPWGRDRELSVCLGYDPENPGMAIVVRKHGVFLENAIGEAIPIGEDELGKYERVIAETIELSIEEKKPLRTKYLREKPEVLANFTER